MIEISGLRKRYRQLVALDGVDLDIQPGRVTAIVGPNAAGKTTLIKAILGLVRLDAGSVCIGGRVIDARGTYRADIGYMPQIARFPDNLTGADLLAILVQLRRAPARDESLLDALQLRPHLDKPLRTLSGGTRQKVNAALAFLFAPSVLILDEPTSGLDPVAAGTVKDKLAAARATGGTVILTSHILSEVDELADDVAFLIDGRIKFVGTVLELKRTTRQFTLERAIAQILRKDAA